MIKVERPGDGDFARRYDHSCGDVSSYFAWINGGKESITLDLSLTGDGEVIARTGISVADIAAGVQLHAAVLAALLHREGAGEGATLKLSLLEALGEWMHQPLLYALSTGTAPARAGAHHASIAPYGPFRCGDGGTVHVAVHNEPQWRRLWPRS